MLSVHVVPYKTLFVKIYKFNFKLISSTLLELKFKVKIGFNILFSLLCGVAERSDSVAGAWRAAQAIAAKCRELPRGVRDPHTTPPHHDQTQ